MFQTLRDLSFIGLASGGENPFFFQDDFSTNNWTDTGFPGWEVLTGALRYVMGATSRGAWIDMAGVALSNTEWIARHQWTVEALSNISNKQINFYWVDNPNLDVTPARDYLGFRCTPINGNIENASGNGQQPYNGSYQAFTTTVSIITYYVQYTRLSATSFKMDLYSDSNYSSLVESQTQTISSGTVGLRYCWANQLDAGGSMTFNGFIDDLGVKDGFTDW